MSTVFIDVLVVFCVIREIEAEDGIQRHQANGR